MCFCGLFNVALCSSSFLTDSRSWMCSHSSAHGRKERTLAGGVGIKFSGALLCACFVTPATQKTKEAIEVSLIENHGIWYQTHATRTVYGARASPRSALAAPIIERDPPRPRMARLYSPWWPLWSVACAYFAWNLKNEMRDRWRFVRDMPVG